MTFKLLDEIMRQYETKLDVIIPTNEYIVARLDGKGFTKLTKDVLKFEKPFDTRFRDLMVDVTIHLMANTGFKIIYAYTQSDEISLLFDLNEILFNRKCRKFNSVLAGEASAKFSLLINQIGVFDCRLCSFDLNLVKTYFSWRKQDAKRNSLNMYSYWTLIKNGLSAKKATKILENLKAEDKLLILQKYGVDYNTIPNWQKQGVDFYWETYLKEGINPLTQEHITTQRNRIVHMDSTESTFIQNFT
jgi:tRNA(His) guanylyltransferase